MDFIQHYEHRAVEHDDEQLHNLSSSSTLSLPVHDRNQRHGGRWNGVPCDEFGRNSKLPPSLRRVTGIDNNLLQGSGVTFQTGEDLVVRSRFLNNGSLANSQDTTFREISELVSDFHSVCEFDIELVNHSNWPVFAFCKDFGTISSTSAPLVWGIGLVRNGNIIYTTTAGNQTRHPYFLTKYADVATAVCHLRLNCLPRFHLLQFAFLRWRIL